MATTMNPQPVPETFASSYASEKTQLTILEEVQANQKHLRDRLAGALSKSPANIPASALPSVPLIDIGPSIGGTLESKKAVAAQIREACLTTGFFQISNHGVTKEAMDGVLKQAERYFHDLTEEQKLAMHIKNSSLFRGYEPADWSYVNPDDISGGAMKETKECFNWGYEQAFDPTGGDGKYREIDGSAPTTKYAGNLWPSEEELPGFYDAIKSYYGQVMTLGRHLFSLFALSLGLEESYFDALVTHPGGIARLLYYKGTPAQEGNEKSAEQIEEEGKLGLGAHTDYECFTLLFNSANPGLEILFPPSPMTDNKPIWRPCPVRPGTFTVNVADFLMRWTNGLYKSTIHRVVSKPGGGERYSVPYFFSINYDSEVLPLPEECCGKSMYPPMKVGEYVLERLKATLA
ncbi:hypothetical protein PV11_00887 [Exophiala sideris]|uniref:Fe2OG dioxygenase domain-containing protein n=1 Tax=Exophiala sideris TaxID=1016849 RepID=A0A0D1W8R4_9EURO|nr:hypothetical protein PV11_00887 [Exophiala sideris]